MIEKHPWIMFPKENQNSTKFILGSFPPNKFTIHKELKTNFDVDFFYGSKENEFWELFSSVLNLDFKLPHNTEQLKNYLELNHWVISDIVLECVRKNNTALDTDLTNIVWNSEIINQILSENQIETIFFTSKWVKDKFDRHIQNNLDKNIKTYILPSPSRNGLRSIGHATYLEYQKNPNETATDFRKRCYKEILNKK